MNEADKIVKCVKRLQWLGFFAMVLCVIALIVFLPWAAYFKVSVTFLAGVFVWLVFAVGAQARVQRLLTFEMQPIKWHYVAYKTNLASAADMAFDADAAYLTGAYQVATDICLAQLAKPTLKPLLRCGVCCVLAQIYFQTEEYEALQGFLPTWERAMQHPKAKKRAEKVYGDELRYLQAFLAGDYAACRRLVFAMKEKQKMPFQVCNADFFDGVAAYRLGERVQASASFAAVRSACPALYISKLAADYLAAIEAGEPYRFLSAPEHTALPPFPIAPSQGRREPKHKKLGILLAAALLALAILMLSVADGLDPTLTPYEAVYEYEEIVELYHTVPLNEEGDALCVYTADDSWFYDEEPSDAYHFLRVAFLACEDGEDYELIDYLDIDEGNTYYMDMGVRDTYVEFCVLPVGTAAPRSFVKSVDFQDENGTDLRLYVLVVRESERSGFYKGYGEK